MAPRWKHSRLPYSSACLQPGTEQTVQAVLHTVRGGTGTQRITLGIPDPMTGKDAVRFAMKAERENGRTVLFSDIG